METICTEQQPSHYSIDAVDFPFWEQGEQWEGYLDSWNPEPSNPFDDTSPSSSFSGSINWIDGHEHLCHACSPVSPMAASPAIHAPEVINWIRAKSTKAEAQDTPDTPFLNSNPKGKPRQPQIITKLTDAVDSKLKPCRSRSTSLSLVTLDCLVTNKEQRHREKDVFFERSRIASSKFRERKRNEIAQLESQEYTREDANRQLRGMLDALTSEILSLKLQLLQHTDCNCELIQAYISIEARHFVKSLQGAKE